ncbi:hypothetical protein HK102_003756 [Quaeritorhiza haematococci]|nr:hypothetical protein HK102_003756 [Quaeritorhiza haematococci]
MRSIEFVALLVAAAVASTSGANAVAINSHGQHAQVLRPVGGKHSFSGHHQQGHGQSHWTPGHQHHFAKREDLASTTEESEADFTTEGHGGKVSIRPNHGQHGKHGQRQNWNQHGQVGQFGQHGQQHHFQKRDDIQSAGEESDSEFTTESQKFKGGKGHSVHIQPIGQHGQGRQFGQHGQQHHFQKRDDIPSTGEDVEFDGEFTTESHKFKGGKVAHHRNGHNQRQQGGLQQRIHKRGGGGGRRHHDNHQQQQHQHQQHQQQQQQQQHQQQQQSQFQKGVNQQHIHKRGGNGRRHNHQQQQQQHQHQQQHHNQHQQQQGGKGGVW